MQLHLLIATEKRGRLSRGAKKRRRGSKKSNQDEEERRRDQREINAFKEGCERTRGDGEREKERLREGELEIGKERVHARNRE